MRRNGSHVGQKYSGDGPMMLGFACFGICPTRFRTLLGEHPQGLSWHGAPVGNAAKPLVAVPGGHLIEPLPHKPGQNFEGLSQRWPSDDHQGFGDGRFTLRGPPVVPQCHSFLAIRQLTFQSQCHCSGAIEGGKSQFAMAGTLPPQQLAHGAVAKGAATIKKKDGPIGNRGGVFRILLHRNFHQNLRHTRCVHAFVGRARAFQKTKSNWHKQSGFVV